MGTFLRNENLCMFVGKGAEFFPISLQDDANKNGGKWIIRLRKGLASRCWENLILAMLGEQFMVGEEICGAVVSVRFQVSHPEGHVCGTRLLACTEINSHWLFCRRISSPYGTRPPVTRQPLPAYGTHYGECSIFPPTPSWSIKHTQTASSTCRAGEGSTCSNKLVLHLLNA